MLVATFSEATNCIYGTVCTFTHFLICTNSYVELTRQENEAGGCMRMNFCTWIFCGFKMDL